MATGRWSLRRGNTSLDELRPLTIAVPGTLTTAYLALRLCLGSDFKHVVVPVRSDSSTRP